MSMAFNDYISFIIYSYLIKAIPGNYNNYQHHALIWLYQQIRTIAELSKTHYYNCAEH